MNRDARAPIEEQMVRDMGADISVVVPNYNHATLLPLAVASLQAQSLSPLEIVIVDDGSTDNSPAVIDSLAASDARIRVIKCASNQGAIAAINLGVRQAQGRFLALVAADDIVEPNLLEVLRSALSAEPGAAFASAEVQLIDLQGRRLGFRPPARPSSIVRHFGPDQVAALLRRIDNFIMTGAALFDRRLFVDAGLLRPELGSLADGYAARRLALRHGFVFVPEILAWWRINPSGLSREAATQVASAEAIARAARNAFDSDPVFPPIYAKRFESRWRFAVLRLALENPRTAANAVAHFSPGPRALTWLFCAMAKQGRPGRLAALAWATAWYRPSSLLAIMATSVARWRDGRSRPSGR
jgi:glycosyltransferase involved in cell wall biosynthesis